MPTLTPLRLQRAVQSLFFALSLFIGWRFYLFCQWAQTGAGGPVARPSGVEGFLPISALLGFKHLLLTGSWDPAHPAGLTIFLLALGTALVLRRGFCAYICPVGLVSNLLASAGRRLALERALPRRVEALARAPKYLLLAFFVFTVALGMSGRALESFLMGRYNLTADAHLLRFFLHPSATALVVLGVLGLVGLVVRNAWCRWLCPYGALMGLLSRASPTRIRRRDDRCVHCGRCGRACPAGIAVQDLGVVRAPECIGCAECVGACPERGALGVTVFGRRVHWSVPALATLGAFVLAWGAARLAGHWDSGLPAMMLKALYASALR